MLLQQAPNEGAAAVVSAVQQVNLSASMMVRAWLLSQGQDNIAGLTMCVWFVKPME